MVSAKLLPDTSKSCLADLYRRRLANSAAGECGQQQAMLLFDIRPLTVIEVGAQSLHEA